MVKVTYGDLVRDYNNYDVIVHGCNCICAMNSGIAPKMARAFGCDKFPMEDKPSLNKLGCIDYKFVGGVAVVNAYTQARPDTTKPALDYEALKLCLRKIRWRFSGDKHVGLPAIGCGLAGGNPYVVFPIIEQELPNHTIVLYGNEFHEVVRQGESQGWIVRR